MPNPLLDTASLPRFAALEPEHVVPAISELIAQHRQKLDALLDAEPAPDFDALVPPLEEMEHELSRAWSPVRHLQGVLSSQYWRDAYNDALPLLTEHSTELSQNTRLQAAYASVQGKLPADASLAQRNLVEHALRDFRLAGVDLPPAEKSRFKEIMQKLARCDAGRVRAQRPGFAGCVELCRKR